MAFDGGGTISKVPIAGGPALPIATAGLNLSPHWGLNDTIVYAGAGAGALYRVGSWGGEPELLLDSDTVVVADPHLLPNGKAVVFGTRAGGGPLNSRILIFEMETGEVRELVASGNNPRYVPPGHVIFGHGDGALMGVPFDLEALQTTGAQVTLLPALTVLSSGASQFSVSETGTLIYDGSGEALGSGGTVRRLVEVDLEGVASPLPLSAGPLDVPRYSPNGNKIAYGDGGGIRVYDVVTGASPLFSAAGRGGATLSTSPVWSPSGEYLYSNVGGAVGDGYRRPSDGSEEATQLWVRPGGNFALDVSPGDSIVVVRDNAPGRGRDLLLMRQGIRRGVRGLPHDRVERDQCRHLARRPVDRVPVRREWRVPDLRTQLRGDHGPAQRIVRTGYRPGLESRRPDAVLPKRLKVLGGRCHDRARLRRIRTGAALR